MIQDLTFNMSFNVLSSFIHGCFVDEKMEDGLTRDSIAKWLTTRPKVLILDEPTRGIDVVAKSEIYSIIDELALSGTAIIMISSDLPEIINMSDRVLVMNGGKIRGCLNKNELTQEKIIHYAIEGD